MKKIVQLALIMLLISSTNGYCWEWPNWRSWFSTTPSKNGFGAWMRTKMTPMPPAGYVELKPSQDNENFVELPRNLEEDKYYKVVKQPISGKIFMKEAPVSESDTLKIMTTRKTKPTQALTPDARGVFIQGIESKDRLYVASPTSESARKLRAKPYKVTRIETLPRSKAFTKHAEESFNKTQQAE